MNDDVDFWEEMAERWPVVLAELNKRKASLVERTTKRDSTRTMEDLRYVQGQVEELGFLANLPGRKVSELRK